MNGSIDQRGGHYARLRALPGVITVGLGWKERDGVVLPLLAYRVHVRTKRPLGELAVEERIPAVLDGMPTDVIVADDCRSAGRQATVLTPGCPIARYIPGTGAPGPGTLTLLVVKNNKHYALTCEHVLDSSESLTKDAAALYSPQHTSCDCRDAVGAIQMVTVSGSDEGDPDETLRKNDAYAIGPNQFRVDAALALVTTPAQGTNQISVPTTPPTTIKFDQGLRDLSTLAFTIAPNPDIPSHPPMRVVTAPVTVHKLGATTQYTSGQVVQLSAQQTYRNALVDLWEMTIKPAPGKAWKQDYLIDGTDPTVIDALIPRFVGKPVTLTKLTGMWVRLTGSVFALPGDSGSPVWDDNGKLVGIVTAIAGANANVMLSGTSTPMTLPNGLATIQYAPAAFQALGLTDASILAAGTPLAGERVDVPRARPLLDLADLEVVRRGMEGTDGGRRLMDLLTRHLDQVTRLVHHRRRVLIVWHRNRGPAFAAAFAQVLREPAGALPREISGVRIEDAVRAFLDVLSIEGDAELARDLAEHGPWLSALALANGSVAQLLATLDAPVAHA